jgi:hypothetical protein
MLPPISGSGTPVFTEDVMDNRGVFQKFVAIGHINLAHAFYVDVGESRIQTDRAND